MGSFIYIYSLKEDRKCALHRFSSNTLSLGMILMIFLIFSRDSYKKNSYKKSVVD